MFVYSYSSPQVQRSSSLVSTESPCVVLKPDARPVKPRLRSFFPAKAAGFAACMAVLMGRLIMKNMQTVWASQAMAAPKRRGYNFIKDNRTLSEYIDKVQEVLLDPETNTRQMRG